MAARTALGGVADENFEAVTPLPDLGDISESEEYPQQVPQLVSLFDL